MEVPGLSDFRHCIIQLLEVVCCDTSWLGPNDLTGVYVASSQRQWMTRTHGPISQSAESHLFVHGYALWVTQHSVMGVVCHLAAG